MFDNDGIIIITSSRSQFIKTGAWGKVLNSQDKKKKKKIGQEKKNEWEIVSRTGRKKKTKKKTFL